MIFIRADLESSKSGVNAFWGNSITSRDVNNRFTIPLMEKSLKTGKALSITPTVILIVID